MKAEAAPLAREEEGQGEGDRQPAVLQVTQLKVHLRVADVVVRAVDGVDLHVAAGECVGIVGESGSGKSTLARAVTRLMPNVALAELSGEAFFQGADTLKMNSDEVRAVRRSGGFSMIFQDPLSSLNPTMRVGRQIAEALVDKPGAAPAEQRVFALMREVGLSNVEHVARRFPHELSGGMRQRIMIAIALASEPRLLFADEPTTALDATVQLQVLETLARLHRDRRMAMVIITHDLGVVAALCDRVYVMRGGQVVESAPTVELFERPRHAYSAQLIAHSRRESQAPAVVGAEPAVEAAESTR